MIWLRLAPILLGIAIEPTRQDTRYPKWEDSVPHAGQAEHAGGYRPWQMEEVCIELERMAQLGELVVSRRQWPQAYQVRARVGDLSTIRPTTTFVLELLTTDETLVKEVRIGLPRVHAAPSWHDPTFAIPWESVHDGAIHLTWRVVLLDASEERRISASQLRPISVPLELVSSINDVLAPSPSWTPDHLAVKLFRAGAVVTILDRLPDDAMGVELLIFGDGELLTRTNAWYDDRSRLRSNIYLPLRIDWGAVVGASDLQAVLVSSAEFALRDFDRSDYWVGGKAVAVVIAPESPSEPSWE